MPVRRHPHKQMASVFAFTGELEAWRDGARLNANPLRTTSPAPRRPVQPAQPKWLAILPFCPAGPEQIQESLPLGLAESLISRLVKLSGLRVIAIESVSRIGCERLSHREAAERLGVDYLLAGTCMRSGERFRITAKLIRTEDDSYEWAEQYDFLWPGIFEIQDQVAQNVLNRLQLTIGPEQRRHDWAQVSPSPESYELLLEGRHNRLQFEHLLKPEYFARAEDFLRRAAGSGSNGSEARGELSLLYWAAFERTGDRRWINLCIAVGLETIERDAANANANTVLALARAQQRDLHAAIATCRKGVESAPSHAMALTAYGVLHFALGFHDLGLDILERSHKLDPLCVSPCCCLILCYAAAGRMDDSNRLVQRTLAIDPRAPLLFSAHGAALLMAGEYSAARKVFEEALTAAPAEYEPLLAVGLGAAHGGQSGRERARAVLESCATDPRTKTPWLLPQLVLLHVAAGEKAAAVNLLRDEPFFSSYPCLLTIKGYDPLRGEASFQRLLRDRGREWDLDRQVSRREGRDNRAMIVRS